jgi:hypothetical protein
MHRKTGEKRSTFLQQISIGGCLINWDDDLYPGDEFRLEMELPNKNYLPLTCKVVYCFDDSGIGAKFIDLSKFEQDLIAKTISDRLEIDGLPLPVDPFHKPPKFENANDALKISSGREKREQKLEEVMALDNEG